MQVLRWNSPVTSYPPGEVEVRGERGRDASQSGVPRIGIAGGAGLFGGRGWCWACPGRKRKCRRSHTRQRKGLIWNSQRRINSNQPLVRDLAICELAQWGQTGWEEPERTNLINPPFRGRANRLARNPPGVISTKDDGEPASIVSARMPCMTALYLDVRLPFFMTVVDPPPLHVHDRDHVGCVLADQMK